MDIKLIVAQYKARELSLFAAIALLDAWHMISHVKALQILQ